MVISMAKVSIEAIYGLIGLKGLILGNLVDNRSYSHLPVSF